MNSHERNAVVVIRYLDSTVSLKKKFKDVEKDIQYGMCYVLDGSLYEMNFK